MCVYIYLWGCLKSQGGKGRVLLLLLFFSRGRCRNHLFGGGPSARVFILKMRFERKYLAHSSKQITIIIIRISRQFPHHKENQPFFHSHHIPTPRRSPKLARTPPTHNFFNYFVCSFCFYSSYCLFIPFFIYCQL